MAQHRCPALRTIDGAVIGVLAARGQCPKRPFFKDSHGIDKGREAIHVDEHSETARAAEHRKTLESTVRERSATDRAQVRRLAEQFDVFGDPRQLLLISAVVAHEGALVAVYPHGGSAIDAVGHEGIIGEMDPDHPQ
jgi:hypothetical protein